TCTLASRQGTISPSNQITPSRSAIDMAGISANSMNVGKPPIPDSTHPFAQLTPRCRLDDNRFLAQRQPVYRCPVGEVRLGEQANVRGWHQVQRRQGFQQPHIVREAGQLHVLGGPSESRIL